MTIKVCGMTDINQIKDLIVLPVQYAGMIFYDRSPRYVMGKINPKHLQSISGEIRLTGVFVNPETEWVKQIIRDYYLGAVQLCGSESPEMCEDLRRYTEILKVVHVDENVNIVSEVNKYQQHCDYFLFDTKSDKYGGTGKKFGWEQLTGHAFSKPFFLSGGISEEDVDALRAFEHQNMVGIDINSRFEKSAGIKDMEKIKRFINQLSI